jgi:hypothetical protein
MAKVTLNDLSNLQNENSAVTTINGNSATIETAFDNTLSRDGSAPNQMEADLDMNSNNILNANDVRTNHLILNGVTVESADLASLDPVGDGKILSNISGSSAIPTGNTLTEVLDHSLGNTQGTLIYRDSTSWNTLPPGTSGQVLKTNGIGQNPSWASSAGTGDMLSINNLSDVASVPTSRVNLGFPSMSSSDYRSTLTVNSAGTGFQIMKRVSLLPDDYGWKASDTLANRHAAMVAWAADPTPGILDKNTDYQIDLATSSLAVAAGKIIDGNGSLIYDTTTRGKLITLTPAAAVSGVQAGGWQIANLNIQGLIGGTTTGVGYGIFVEGTDNTGTSAAPYYVDGLLLDSVNIHSVDMVAMWAKYLQNGVFRNVKVYDASYGGLMFLSGLNIRASDIYVKDTGAGNTFGNSYPVGFTRDTAGTVTTNPRSYDCVLDRWRVENNTLWEAVDTHAGEKIKILNGYAYNTKRGINVGYDADGAGALGPVDCVVQNCTVVAGDLTTAASILPGMWCIGYQAAGTDEALARNNKFIGNTVIGHGDHLTSAYGGMYIEATRGTLVDGCTFKQCASNGLIATNNNTTLTLVNNTLEDAYSDSTASSGIYISGVSNQVTLGNNRFRHGSPLSFVPGSQQPYGVTVLSDATNTLSFTGGDQFDGLHGGGKYNVGASAKVLSYPGRHSGQVSVSIAAGAISGTASVTFKEALTAISLACNGQTIIDSAPIIYGPSSVTTSGFTLTARTTTTGSVGSTGGSATAYWIAQGYPA